MSKTPKLRFPEFSGVWEEKKLGNEFQLSSGSTPSKANKEYFNGDNYWVTSGELKKKYIKSTIDKISDNAIKECNLKKYPSGTFVIAIYGLEASGTRGSCSILKSDATISQACMAFKPKGKVSNEFLYYWYIKHGEKIGIKYAQGTKQQNLNSDLVGDIKITIPYKEEQQKIANFFSLIDKKIEKQQEKVKALKDYKKGMMQKIFSREIRFKGDNGEEYPEWEEKKLMDIAECLDNRRKPLNSNERSIIQGNIPYYGANGVVDFVNKYIFNEDIILLAEDGGNFDDFATKPIAQLVKGKSWINNHAHVLKAKYNTDFLFYSLVHKDIRKYINGTSRAKLNKSDMLDILVKMPKSLDEQVKISKFLEKIYTKLEKEQEKLDSLNEWKKGLLQQMFV
ncbi:restriction endonuclease subunit S [Clostridium taeniosporum]|uniref:Type I restriction modification DNA specificity domain-containing protein n=1 Tax=Clostridium taeniosporum TaxID=394958 RepID=A0A2I6SDK8_9CLOT|nr:restriction endonuclease subunit S [Clostridium taeniosporum]AUO15658.1 hypothetical protein BGI42_16055 [Clostridium taeniosporum]